MTSRVAGGSQTVERALSVLDVRTEVATPLRLTELARAAELNISTVSRLLGSLERYQYVVRDPHTRRYRLGYKILQMAKVVQDQAQIPELAHPILTELMAATKETATVNVLHQGQAMIIARVEYSSPLRIVSQVGNHNPLYCTAAGKTLLAFTAESEVERILAQGMPPRTPRTITTPEAMYRELARIREQGYTLDLGERDEGLIGIAAPVRDASGDVVAECGVSGSAQRVTEDKIPTLVIHVKDAAAALSDCLGWCPAVRAGARKDARHANEGRTVGPKSDRKPTSVAPTAPAAQPLHGLTER